MSSRQDILDRVRQAQPPEVPLPVLQGNWLTFPDPVAQFRQVLESVGGRVLEAASTAVLPDVVQQVEVYREAERVWSLVPSVASSGGDWAAISDPHEFESLQCCVVPGAFAVAENAAVWIPPSTIPHRAPLFVTQHLLLVVSARDIVANMHEAYQRISFDAAGLGVFISGPSKTADIEQSLVIGAHGARSLTAVLVHNAA